jgi:hypothetical protein
MSFELLSWLISPVDLPGSLNFFHAGTSLMWNGTLVTTGGRVMAVSATADSLEAVKLAYTGVSMVSFEGMFYRRDVAHRLILKSPFGDIDAYAVLGRCDDKNRISCCQLGGSGPRGIGVLRVAMHSYHVFAVWLVGAHS